MIKERELIEKLCSSEKTYSDWLLLRLEAIEFFTKPEQEQEPVAWIIETEIYGKLSEWVCTDKKHYMEAHDGTKDPIPLYLAPQKREPLSESEIAFIWGDSDYDVAVVRRIEKAHGIGGGE